MNSTYLQDALNDIPFEARTSRITDFKTGAVTFELDRAFMPASYSQVATDIMAQKYFRRAGVTQATIKVPEEGVPVWLQRSVPVDGAVLGGEDDARQVFHRLAGCWTYWGWKNNYFKTEAEAIGYYQRMLKILATQSGAPNSPQWFNTGLHWAYGITGPAQGHWYVDNDGVPKLSTSAYERPAPHACFILGLNDNLVGENGILSTLGNEARIFKFGAGSGVNYSKLRGAGEGLSGGGKSSGLMSFLKVFDVNAGSIKSGGTTRRAARMVVVDADHPDIEEFTTWKVDEEQKVAMLVAGSISLEKHLNAILAAANDTAHTDESERYNVKKNLGLRASIREARHAGIPDGAIQQVVDLARQGINHIDVKKMDAGWTSDAYATVSGQNSNNSVRLADGFLQAVGNNGPWNLINRTDGKVAKTIEATSLWDRIALAAWKCADPGIQYDTTLNDWHTCPVDGRLNASNPCSEYQFLDNTACNLASINLVKYLNADSTFDIASFVEAVHDWTTTLDISVTMSHLPSKEVAIGTFAYRTLGLGYANLGTLLMRMGLAYDSEEGRNFCAAITALMHGEAERTSAELAQNLGAFPRYEANRTDMLRVIRNHHRAAYGHTDGYEKLSTKPVVYNPIAATQDIWDTARGVWDDVLELGNDYGFRNAQVTVIAPTGTIGLLMDCDTTGIEPDFALVKFKSLAGGGNFKIVNQSVGTALKTLGYTPNQIQDIETYAKGTLSLSGSPYINAESLTEKGFGQVQIDAINDKLQSAFHLQYAFNHYVLGEAFCTEVLGLTMEQLANPDFSILRDGLGFTQENIEEASSVICGTMTVEGAPHLKEDHLSVFDCATICGLLGTRYIAAKAHIDMMAAAQPFLSGSISKTVNLPQSATIEDVKEAYWYSWTVGVKAIALYRDGSKLSQPLSAALADVEDESPFPTQSAAGVMATVDHLLRGQRKVLARRCAGYRQKFTISQHDIFVHTGEYEDGKVGEIFIDMHKEGAAFRAMMNNFAIAISMGLQHGVPLEKYVDAFTFVRFEPNGPVVGHDNIKTCTSILDAIFRDLAITYLGRDDLAHVKPTMEMDALKPKENYDSTNGHAKEEASTHRRPESVHTNLNTAAHASAIGSLSATDVAKAKGYTGNSCNECGQMTMVRNGSCEKCDSCGATSGCS